MAGFREFATGEVLTAANVNNFLMKQSVMVFADAAARTAALGAEVAEGMLTYNEDTGALEVFDGADFVEAGGGGGREYVGSVYFTSGGTFVKDDPLGTGDIGLGAVRVRCQGGGGGGGSTTGQDQNASGGGGGGYSERFVLASALTSSVSVVVGSGGGAQTAGGASSFGTVSDAFHVIANGGPAGAINAAGEGAAPGTGDLAIGGSAGQVAPQNAFNQASASGGASHLGGGGRGQQAQQSGAGLPGRNHGGGGGGASTNSAGDGAKAGGAGAPGVVIVDLFA